MISKHTGNRYNLVATDSPDALTAKSAESVITEASLFASSGFFVTRDWQRAANDCPDDLKDYLKALRGDPRTKRLIPSVESGAIQGFTIAMGETAGARVRAIMMVEVDGRAAEARPHLEKAVAFARALPSPVGALRATWALGKMHEALGERDAALRAYVRAEKEAIRLGVASLRRAARKARERLAKGNAGPL